MVKSICVNLAHTDSDALCSIHKALCKLPCMFKYDTKRNELLITAQPRILAIAEKVVAKYV
jgi:hypothetical protein